MADLQSAALATWLRRLVPCFQGFSCRSDCLIAPVDTQVQFKLRNGSPVRWGQVSVTPPSNCNGSSVPKCRPLHCNRHTPCAVSKTRAVWHLETEEPLQLKAASTDYSTTKVSADKARILDAARKLKQEQRVPCLVNITQRWERKLVADSTFGQNRAVGRLKNLTRIIHLRRVGRVRVIRWWGCTSRNRAYFQSVGLEIRRP